MDAIGPKGAIGVKKTIVISGLEQVGVPSGATSILARVSVFSTARSGFISLWNGVGPVPASPRVAYGNSDQSFIAIIQLSPSNSFSIYSSAAVANVRVEMMGYFTQIDRADFVGPTGPQGARGAAGAMACSSMLGFQ